MQEAFNDLNLVSNSTKTKVMWSGTKQLNNKDIITPDGAIIEVVSSYKYLRIWLDSSLTCTTHITNLQKKVKSRLSFCIEIDLCLPRQPRNILFKLLLCPCSIMVMLYIEIQVKVFWITNAPYRTHHCELYSLLNWTSLCIRRETHWYIFTYKVLLGLLPKYLHKLLKPHSNTYTTRSSNYISLAIPRKKTTYGRSAFEFAAPNDWNMLTKVIEIRAKYSSMCIKIFTSECFDLDL